MKLWLKSEEKQNTIPTEKQHQNKSIRKKINSVSNLISMHENIVEKEKTEAGSLTMISLGTRTHAANPDMICRSADLPSNNQTKFGKLTADTFLIRENESENLAMIEMNAPSNQ